MKYFGSGRRKNGIMEEKKGGREEKGGSMYLTSTDLSKRRGVCVCVCVCVYERESWLSFPVT
jgi:hypothetical protein